MFHIIHYTQVQMFRDRYTQVQMGRDRHAQVQTCRDRHAQVHVGRDKYTQGPMFQVYTNSYLWEYCASTENTVIPHQLGWCDTGSKSGKEMYKTTLSAEETCAQWQRANESQHASQPHVSEITASVNQLGDVWQVGRHQQQLKMGIVR